MSSAAYNAQFDRRGSCFYEIYSGKALQKEIPEQEKLLFI